MKPFREQGRREGFFITAFGPRADFVHQALHEEALKARATLVKLDAAGSEPNLHQRLTDALRGADFITVDLSPADLSSSGSFNPNVMFEYGRAMELVKPIFSICDAAVLEKNHLPFDIAQMFTVKYELHPGGLERIAKRFSEWLAEDEQLKRYALAHDRIENLVRLRDNFVSWEEPTMHLFGPVIDVVTGRLENYANGIDYVNGRMEGELPFAPLRRQDMIEAVFCATLKSMKSPDVYDTVSTVEFWREIQEGSGLTDATARLLAETKKSLARGVCTRRLFLVPSWDIGRAVPFTGLLKEHDDLRADYPDKYELAYYIVPNQKEYDMLRTNLHVGVCSMPSMGVDFVLKPRYESRAGGYLERLAALDYRLGRTTAETFKHGIDTLWNSGGRHGARLLNKWDDVAKVLGLRQEEEE